MRNYLPTSFATRYACLAWFGILVASSGAQTPVLKWDRDSIVEKEYQASFCQGKPERAGICSDAFSITQSGSQKILIDSIFFKVTTPGIQSSQAMLRYNQNILYFAYHSSGRYPWKIPEYNDPGSAKISIDPFQKVDFTGVEMDNCFYGCPVSQSAAQSKFLVTGVLIFVLNNGQRDTLTLMGLQNQYDPTPIYRRPNSGVNKVSPEKPDVHRNTNGRLIGSLHSKGSDNPEISFSCCSSRP
jgi:hypothetical protein